MFTVCYPGGKDEDRCAVCSMLNYLNTCRLDTGIGVHQVFYFRSDKLTAAEMERAGIESRL